MFGKLTRRITARLFFFAGALFMFVGSAFLLGSIDGSSRPSVLISFLFVIAGIVCAVLAIRLHKRSTYLFIAAFFIQVGFFLFLSALRLFPVPFSRAWPLVSVFSGIALFPAGWHRYGVIRSNYLVPSAVFVVLGSVLLLFSFRVVPFSFAQFILKWWPLLVVLAGLLLVLLSLGTPQPHDGSSSQPGTGQNE